MGAGEPRAQANWVIRGSRDACRLTGRLQADGVFAGVGWARFVARRRWSGNYGGPVFIIASTGRCGTQAICDAFGRYSDHQVRHEPEPLLLAEAQRAHIGRWRYSPTYLKRMWDFRRRNGDPYGESVRCPTLVGDIARVAPSSTLMVLFRRPSGYVASAWSRGVMRKGDQWDQWRILPHDADGRSVVDLIGLHYAEVNRILADTVVGLGDRAITVEVGELDVVVDQLASFAGVAITDRQAMAELLAKRPNAGPSDRWGDEQPDALSADVASRADAEYQRMVELSAR